MVTLIVACIATGFVYIVELCPDSLLFTRDVVYTQNLTHGIWVGLTTTSGFKARNRFI
jgi:hypothetical protein